MQQTVAQQTGRLSSGSRRRAAPAPPLPSDVVVGRVWHGSGAALGAAVAGVSSDKTHSLTVSEDGLLRREPASSGGRGGAAW